MRKAWLTGVVAAAAIAAACGGAKNDAAKAPEKLRFMIIPKTLDIPVFN